MCKGELISAIAMTEPGAGSDLKSISTTAIKDSSGKHYTINGSKTFITNGYLSDIVIVVAKTDKAKGGISLFLVETNTPGFKKGRKLNKMGLKVSLIYVCQNIC